MVTNVGQPSSVLQATVVSLNIRLHTSRTAFCVTHVTAADVDTTIWQFRFKYD
jgi:hypothetical protein